MKDIKELKNLFLELLENITYTANLEITKRGREIIDEISDYAEQTGIFQEFKKRGKTFDNCSAQQMVKYMLDRVAKFPTTIHRDSSVILIMPFLRQKLSEEERK